MSTSGAQQTNTTEVTRKTCLKAFLGLAVILIGAAVVLAGPIGL